jgi:hypothetical protein
MDLSSLTGPTVEITVVRVPRTARQLKTLVRLLGKDIRLTKADRVITRVRAKNVVRRQQSGRIWVNRSRKPPLIKGRPGESGIIPRTAEVMRALPSLGDTVAVK